MNMTESDKIPPLLKKERVEEKEHLIYVDIAKGLGLIFVVFGHMFTYGGFLSKIIFSFHMPLFFFLSGYCFNPVKNNDFEVYATKKFQSLFIPYIVFCFIGLIFTFINSSWREGIGKYTVIEVFYFAQPETLHVGQVWFLICLLNVELLAFWIYKYWFKKIHPLFVVITLLFLAIGSREISFINHHLFILGRAPLKFDSAIPAIVFFFTGFYLHKLIDPSVYFISTNKKAFIEKLRDRPIKVFVVGVVLMILDIFISIKYLGWVNICSLKFNNIICYWITAFIGISGVLFLSCTIEKVLFLKRMLSFLGKNSLILFSLHSLLIYVVCMIASWHYGYIIQNGINVPHIVSIIGGILIIACFFPLIFFINKFKTIIEKHTIK
jgi:fucose 4-O-acetylase-like acetyltransferase